MPRTVYVVVNIPPEDSESGVGAMEWRDEVDELPSFGPDDQHYVVTVPDRHADSPTTITDEFDAFLGEYDLPEDYEVGPISFAVS